MHIHCLLYGGFLLGVNISASIYHQFTINISVPIYCGFLSMSLFLYTVGSLSLLCFIYCQFIFSVSLSNYIFCQFIVSVCVSVYCGLRSMYVSKCCQITANAYVSMYCGLPSIFLFLQYINYHHLNDWLKSP